MQPDIYLGSLRIAEPVIALTGLGIALICAFAWWRLRSKAEYAAPYRWMTRFFGLMAVSSALGPVFGHMFYYWAGFPGKYACWFFSILSIGALAQAAIEHASPLLARHLPRKLTWINLAGVVAALVIALVTQKFYAVEAHSALGMLGFLLPLEAYVYRKQKDPGSRLLLWSLLPAVVSLIPVLLKWSPGVWFSYFDVGHVILYGSFWLMYLGARQMRMGAAAA